MRQLSLQYSFPFKFFELLQFGGRLILEEPAPFAQVFARIKELNLFELSQFYQKHSNRSDDQFANYVTGLINGHDYTQIHFTDLAKDYDFTTDLYDDTTPYWKSTPRYIDPRTMHEGLQAVVTRHVSGSAEIFRLNAPLAGKQGPVAIWEDLQHYLCIDYSQKAIQLITSGFD